MKPYLRYIFKLVWQQKKAFLLLLGLVVLETLARLGQPYLYKILVDSLADGLVAQTFNPATVQVLIVVVAIWFCLSVFNNLLNAETQFLGWEIGTVASQVVHLDGYRKLLRLDYYKHTQKHSSQFAKIVDEADTSVWEMINWWLNRFLPATLGFIGMIIIALSVNIQMTLLSLAVIPPGLILIITIIKRNEQEQHRINKLWNLKHEHMSDQISNIITYKLNQDEKRFLAIQEGYSDRASDAQRALNKKWRLASMLNPDVLARFLVMGLGVFMVKDGKITIGTLFMFMGLLHEILAPLHLLGDILPQYSRRARHIDRYLDLQHEADELREPQKKFHVKSEGIKGRIEFRDVSFKYREIENKDDKDDTVDAAEHENNENIVVSKKGFGLEHVSFTVEPGQHVALVGHSGAGKSTIVSLITRLVDPTDGQILLDGKDIREFAQEEYRSFFGTVLQEHSLYNETIAQNIAYGKFDASREEIVSAAIAAQANGFIEKLPKGYDTLIGERGVRLSGGEKQRLAIARAMLKRPKVVVLDEPTSALDSITEAKVQKALTTLVDGRTTLTIAHRLSTVRNADIIIIINGGKILAQGSHAQLLHTCGEYREMVDLQTGGFLSE